MMQESRQRKGTRPTGWDEWDGRWRIDPRHADSISRSRTAAMTAAAEGIAGRCLPCAAPNVPPSAIGSMRRASALISPTFLYALVLLAVPILVVIAHSFWTQNYLTIDRTFTLENTASH